MKKIRKIVALALATVMMMAMSITAFAAETTTITVKNAENAAITYAQVLKQDNTTKTGWAFTTNEFAKVFKDASKKDSDQDAINAYINGTESERATLIAGIATSNTQGVEKNVITVSEAGLYVISATEEGYSYAKMAAGVGMSYEDGKATGLAPAETFAKKEPTKVKKEAKDYVETNTEEITYTVSTTVPYVTLKTDETFVGATFAVNDKITGGEYAVDENGFLPVEVYLNDVKQTQFTSVEVKDNAFSLDLSELVTPENKNANVPVKVVYKAIATTTTVNNEAFPTIKGHKYDSENGYDTEKVFTYSGEIKIYKFDKNDTPLNGAKFAVLNTDGKFAKFSNNVLVAWVDEADVTDDCYVETANDGTVLVKGFDPTKKYTVREISAPNGYSIIDEEFEVVWNDGKALPEKAEVIYGKVEFKDSPLAQLPFTGGMGTTIFTILGVAIMAMAAALYFSTKKSSSK